jgi:predicted RNA-binding protein with PIN domain
MIAQILELTVKDFATKIHSMPYLIDGHNLIPKIPGLSLSALDDENQLIELLQEFCRHSRKQVEVYFDNAPPNGVRARNFGLLTARFVRAGTTADVAIRNRLTKLGRSARNWSVVSSDHAVQNFARAAQAQSIPSETFAQLLQQTLDETLQDSGEVNEIALSSDELDDWMRLFGENGEAN